MKFDVIVIDKLTKKLDRINANFESVLVKKMKQLTIQLVNKIKKDKLSGQVLKVKTGRLRNSIHQEVNVSDNTITARVGTKVNYAPAHEYGFKGPVNVKAHLRNITKAFGQPIESKQVQVKSFMRQMDLPERSFFRSSLEEMRVQINQELLNTVKEELKK